MALRCTWLRRVSVNVPAGEEIDTQVFYRQMMDKRKRASGWSGWTTSRFQSWIVVGGILVAGAVFLGPWLVEETREMLGYNVTILEPSAMIHTTPDWWENEWRKMNVLWRKGECTEGFYLEPYRFIASVTGKDMAHPEQWFHKNASTSSPSAGSSTSSFIRKLFPWGSSAPKAAQASAAPLPKALVPLCGDSPIMRELVLQGYQVDGVDVSETAIRTCVEKMEVALRPELFSRLTLHWKEFFSPALWRNELGEKASYDFIYDRQALSAINPDQREDYTYLLKRALKDDGVLYVEGIFRTGRVKGNKVRGPPYGLSRAELRELFHERDGYFVQCRDTEDNAIKLLDRESKVLRRVPKALHVTPFPCVVFREQATIGTA